MAKEEWVGGRPESTQEVYEWVGGQPAVSIDGTEEAPPSANPKGPLGHPLYGALAGPIA